LGDHDPGDIWGTRQDGVFVVVSSQPANWRGEDRDVYAHIDTWYTIRDATEAETALWTAAVEATTARKQLRKRLINDDASFIFAPGSRLLVNTMRALDSYDDRWQPPAPVSLDDEAMAIEQGYIEALSQLKGHQ